MVKINVLDNQNSQTCMMPTQTNTSQIWTMVQQSNYIEFVNQKEYESTIHCNQQTINNCFVGRANVSNK